MTNAARKHLIVFLVAVFVVSFAIDGYILSVGGLKTVGAGPVFALMWTPGVVALAMRALWRRQLPAFGWRLPRFRWLALAYALPPVVALLGYSLAWLTGLAPLEVPWDRIAEKVAPGALGLVGVVVMSSTSGIVTGLMFALGEEIGWRGLMVPLLVNARVPKPFLVSGLIWGLWHLPLVVFGDYATSSLPWLSAALFVVATAADGVTMGWMRVTSVSLWPAVLMHASHNAFFQTVFDKLTGSSPSSQFVAGESGVFPIVFCWAFAAWVIITGRSRRAIAGALEAPAPAASTSTSASAA